jgi:hypothetical protein
MSVVEEYIGYSRSGYRFLLDEYPNAEIAYSVYKLDSGYAGNCAQIIRTGTAEDQSFGFDSNNLLDIAAINAFFTPNTVYRNKPFSTRAEMEKM